MELNPGLADMFIHLVMEEHYEDVNKVYLSIVSIDYAISKQFAQ